MIVYLSTHTVNTIFETIDGLNVSTRVLSREYNIASIHLTFAIPRVQ